jgi:uncharacterized protein (DUF2252 family)
VAIVFSKNIQELLFAKIWYCKKLQAMFKDKYDRGKVLREKTPRASHATWKPHRGRASVESMISQSNYDRIPELIPIRHFRMSKSPFTFYRATASLMAQDLKHTPASGITVQACGDCHLMNFGGFATPERNLVFDINDFDETYPAPWEWDVKRLAASFVLACREKHFSAGDANRVMMSLLNSYIEKINEYARMNFLELWYSKLTFEEVLKNARTDEGRNIIMKSIRKAAEQSHDKVFYKITANTLGNIEISNQPPLVYHPASMKDSMKLVLSFMDQYKSTMQKDRRLLLDQYKVIDVALKIVGVGSVGTRCYVILLMNENKEPVFLQAKEARHSVLEQVTKKNGYEHQGERIVQGQRLIHSATDIFLGWASGPMGRHFYLRQLRDKKLSPQVEQWDRTLLSGYAALCGNVLARAHCKTGQGPFICGYLGKGEAFANAVCRFASSYADQTEKDFEDFMKAVKAGRLVVEDDVPKAL